MAHCSRSSLSSSSAVACCVMYGLRGLRAWFLWLHMNTTTATASRTPRPTYLGTGLYTARSPPKSQFTQTYTHVCARTHTLTETHPDARAHTHTHATSFHPPQISFDTLGVVKGKDATAPFLLTCTSSIKSFVVECKDEKEQVAAPPDTPLLTLITLTKPKNPQ